MALTDIKVRTVKPVDKPFKLTDGEGMHLLVNPNGSKYWRLQYRFSGKQKMLALGGYPMVSLAEARKRRDSAKKLVSDGVDPSQKKKEDKIEESGALTFEAVARDWHASCSKKWSVSHSERVLKGLVGNLFPALGKHKISELKTRDLLAPIKIVETSGRHEVAAHLQQRATAIMRFAVQNGLLEYNPAQDMAGAVAVAKRIHRPALSFERINELPDRIECFSGRKLTKLAVKLTLLVFIRSSELRFARWEEIDFKNALWTIPAEREPLRSVKHSHRGSKMRTPHLVPLSRQAMKTLEEIKQISGDYQLIFIGDHHSDRPMSENIVNKAPRSMGYDTKTQVCGHGFRAMACSALLESGLWSRDAIERQMSHQERNAVRAAYIHKAEHLEERRLILQWWADYLDENLTQSVLPFSLGNKLD
ncbi:tyrosine-type recombinase/integrase [Morganella morganii]|uniref:tyrosine-type recombinase/integrase n=1 Tax=Morganella morganii TaxID=582 RepID=UPI0034D43A71